MALLLEVGLLLILLPWSSFWDQNYLADALPGLQDLLRNNYVRGAASGLGVLNVYAALTELADVFVGGRDDDPAGRLANRHEP